MNAIRRTTILLVLLTAVFLNTRTEVVQVVGGARESTEWMEAGWPFAFYSWKVNVVNQKVPKFAWAKAPRLTVWARLDEQSNLYLAHLVGNSFWWACAAAICTSAIKKEKQIRFQTCCLLAIHVLVAVALAR